MKRLVLIISFLTLVFSNVFKIDSVYAQDVENNSECDNSYNSIVRIVDNYNRFRGNGILYKNNDKYSYIVTSYSVVSDSVNFGVIYTNGEYKQALLIGVDKDNEIAVFKTDKVDEILPVCISRSSFLEKGEVQYIAGYLDNDTEYFGKTTVSNIGELYKNNGYKKIYKNKIDYSIGESLFGISVFDSKGRFSGVITGKSVKISKETYVCESDRVVKIADSIIKSGKYKINYIKYKVVSYSSLDVDQRDEYEVNRKIKYGVVVITFKPFSFLFGGLNMGMVITEVNGVEVKNEYEFDRQLLRYKKGSRVCLSVVKKNGKLNYYFVKI